MCASAQDSQLARALVVGWAVLSQNRGQIDSTTHRSIHPRYNTKASAHDAAILKLEPAVTARKPIKLATASQNNLENSGRKLRVAGWGYTSEDRNPADRIYRASWLLLA
jgi:hypothetical protein